MPFDYTREYLAYAYSVLELGVTRPNPTQTYVGLLRSGISLPSTPTLLDFVQNEVNQDNPINGYLRQVLGQVIGAVDTAADTLTVSEHNRPSNQEVWLISTGSLPAPLTVATPYYINSPTTNTIKLAATSNGSAIDLTGLGSGSHYLRMGGGFNATNKRYEAAYDEARFAAVTNDLTYQGVFIAYNAAATSSNIITSIDTTTDAVTTTTAHNLTTGDRVLITADTGGTQPGGTNAATAYWVRVTSTTTVTLHTSAANAIANTGRVDITTTGSGTLRLRNAVGISVGWDYFATAITIPATRTQTLQIPTYLTNQRTTAGLP